MTRDDRATILALCAYVVGLVAVVVICLGGGR
jgi:hypothetical protein